MQIGYYKSVQSFRVTCLFIGQYETREYGTIAGVISRLEPHEAPPSLEHVVYNLGPQDFFSYQEKSKLL